jgi:uncharacterized protein YozE (UPF0346 family)
MKTFYEFVLTYRGAVNEKGYFAEAVFEDSLFPRRTSNFHELSQYVEMNADAYMKTSIFDEIWDEYATKYSL